MYRRISVEAGLEHIKSHLNARGYEVVDMDNCPMPVEAVVFNGQALESQSSAGCTTAENTVLVNATGLSPEEVAIQLENKLG